MEEQLKFETLKCETCFAKKDHSLLVSIMLNEEWTLMLCPKNVKEKLNGSVSLESASEEIYKRFRESFCFFLSCPSFSKQM